MDLNLSSLKWGSLIDWSIWLDIDLIFVLTFEPSTKYRQP